MELEELVELKLVLDVEAEVELCELEVLEKELLVLLIELEELVELSEVLEKLVLLIELLVLEIEVLELVELDDVELIELEVLLIELDVLEVDTLVELVLAEVLVELNEVEDTDVEFDVELVLKVLAEVLDVEVVVPVGNKKKVAIAHTHWIEALAPKVAAWPPPVVTNRSSAATATTSGAPTETRLTKLPPAEKVLARGIRPAPINNSLFWLKLLLLPDDRAFELPVVPVCLSNELA